LGGGGLGGGPERGIDSAQVLGEGVELGFKCIAGGGEPAFERDGHRPGGEAKGEILRGGHGVGKLNFVLLHDGGDGGFDEGGREARKHGGEAAEDLLIEHGALGEVGDLGGAADVSSGGKDSVLKNGAEERV